MILAPHLEADRAELRASVCVIGAGPAGITAAMELENAGYDVILLDSGGMEFDASTFSLLDAEIVATAHHAPMELAVRRQFGGTSSIWGGRCVPLDRIDFEPRPQVAAAWPCLFEDVARYYPRACEYLLCGRDQFTVKAALPGTPSTMVPGFSQGEARDDSLERWSLPIDFGSFYRERIRASTLIRLLLGFTCVELLTDASNTRLAHAHCRSVSGAALDIHAQIFVVACGGLESTRLLLNSDRTHPGGLGNQSGHLGRHYMGHISGKIARICYTTDPRQTIFGFEQDADNIYCRRRYTLAHAVQLNEGLLNCAFWLDNPALADPSHGNGILSAAYLALRSPLGARLAPEAIRVAAIKTEAAEPSVWAHVANVVRGLWDVATFIPPFMVRRYLLRRRIPGFFLHSRSNRYALHYHAEHAPHDDSSVSLGSQRDDVGMRRLRIDIRFHEIDVDSVIRSHAILDRHLQASAVGHLEYISGNLSEAVARQATDGFHQIGTTRMCADSSDGVVDVECALHACPNVFIASSSVFPTSGQANPTLTIVALAIRIAAHIGRTLPVPQPSLSRPLK